MITTRTAPQGARFSRPTARHLANVDAMVARVAAFGGGGRMTASAADIAPADPAPAAPNTPADTAACLDAQDTQLADHEARIAGLEQRSAPPANARETQSSSQPAAAAVAPAPQMISGAAIFARMNAPRSTGLKAAASKAPRTHHSAS